MVTKKHAFLLLVCLAFSLASTSVFAQRSKDREEEPPQKFSSKLWYGGGVLLGFSGISGANVFSFGLSPMVGFKVLKSLSIGPRVEFIYTSYKQVGFKTTNLFDVDAGVFARAKVFRGLFFQGELSNQWYQNPYLGSNEKESRQRFNQRLGAGWNWSSGQAGSEIGVFYNFAIANELDTYQNPLNYRFAFTWNF